MPGLNFERTSFLLLMTAYEKAGENSTCFLNLGAVGVIPKMVACAFIQELLNKKRNRKYKNTVDFNLSLPFMYIDVVSF